MSVRYWLARGCFVCCANETAVLFNANTGGYFTFTAAMSNLLSHYINEWPLIDVKHGPSLSQDVNNNPSNVINDLCSQRVLVAETALGRTATPVSIIRARNALLDEYDVTCVHLTPKDFFQFALATSAAVKVLGRCRPDRAYRAVLRYSAALGPAELNALPRSILPLSEMKRILAVFRQLRPMLWPSKNRALFEQLILLKLFMFGGYRPQWIFGVLPAPFRMQSWLQYGDAVIDEPPGVTAALVPIMVL